MKRMILGTSPVAAPFWEATKEKKFLLQFCATTGKAIWYPRDFSPHALGGNVEWREASGKGVVYAVSVMHRPGNPAMAEAVPYAVALIDLEEGARMLSNVVNCDPDSIKVGDKVKPAWEPLEGGRHLPVFELA